jgi:hypothetical protein
MGDKTLLLQAVYALCEIVSLKKEREMVQQDFDHAGALFLQAVRTNDDMVQFLMELSAIKEQGSLTDEAYRRILRQVATLLRNQVHFSRACLSILDRHQV